MIVPRCRSGTIDIFPDGPVSDVAWWLERQLAARSSASSMLFFDKSRSLFKRSAGKAILPRGSISGRQGGARAAVAGWPDRGRRELACCFPKTRKTAISKNSVEERSLRKEEERASTAIIHRITPAPNQRSVDGWPTAKAQAMQPPQAQRKASWSNRPSSPPPHPACPTTATRP